MSTTTAAPPGHTEAYTVHADAQHESATAAQPVPELNAVNRNRNRPHDIEANFPSTSTTTARASPNRNGITPTEKPTGSSPPQSQRRSSSRPAVVINKIEDVTNIHHQLKQYTPTDIRAHFVAMTGEFVGTFLFLWFALAGTSYAVNQSTSGSADSASGASTQGNSDATALFISYYSSVIFGMSLLGSVWVFYRISGGLFNPAVTLGLVLSDQLPIVRGLLLFPAQLLASICASALVRCMFPGQLSAVTRLAGGATIAQGLFIEMFLTAMLVIAVLMLAAEKSKDTFLAPVGIGLVFFAAELVGIPYTGGSLNPVRSFGPDAATSNFPGYHWIYWLGPLMGAALAAGYYRFAKFLNYHEANPGQDAAHPNEEHWDPEDEDV